MKKYFILITFFVILISLFVFVVFKSNISKNKSKEITIQNLKNDIFSKDLFNELVEINYWYGNEKIIIDNEEDINAIYNLFASLELSEFNSSSTNTKYGHVIIDFITSKLQIGVGLLTDEIKVDGITYRTNKDIVAAVRDIAIKHKNE
ncbi:MAG: hypothetical protein K0S76_3016 [Herbinix sp.]|nr:hypothetical protein [Herbinix sp.]